MLVELIERPTLLVDEDKCRRNIRRIVTRANEANAVLRPHFKTHHSAEIGNWFKAFGINACTVSSIDMAHYFANNDWKDITIAFPFNPRQSKLVNEIALKCQLNILIESEESLSLANKNLTNDVGYFIKLDIGTHRTGINPGNHSLIRKLIASSNNKITFKGFLAHAGHTYTKDIQYTKQVYYKSLKTLTDLNSMYGGIISYGDTPSCSIIEDYSGIDEVRAGNFAFYDLMQVSFGSCEVEDIAVCLAAPIVALHPERNEVIVHGGAIHLSKDSIELDGHKTFGRVVQLNDHGWTTNPIGYVSKLSQEHGIITVDDEAISNFKIGGLVGILPIHSCLAADLQGSYLSTSGRKIKKIIKL